MKKIILTGCFLFLLIINHLLSQEITNDTTLANNFYNLSRQLFIANKLDSAYLFNTKAQEIYIKHLGEQSLKNSNSLNLLGMIYLKRSDFKTALNYFYKAADIRKSILGDKSLIVALTYENIGNIYAQISEFDNALDFHFKSLEIKKELYEDGDINLASSYNNIGNILRNKSELNKSMEYFLKCLEIQKRNLGESNDKVAKTYNNLGTLYEEKAEYALALEYYYRALKIKIELFGEKNADLAHIYNNIGNVFSQKSEYNKALEYHQKSLEISMTNVGEKNLLIADSYTFIGNDYFGKYEYDKALEFYYMNLQIQKEILGETHLNISSTYNNIGNVYFQKTEYNTALDFYFKCLEINKYLLGEKNIQVANSYSNIGVVYAAIKEFDKALEYDFKSLLIRKDILGTKHTDVANSYNNIGLVYKQMGSNKLSLEYFQKGISSSLMNFNDSVNNYIVPQIKNIIEWSVLMKGLQKKAEILADTSICLSEFNGSEGMVKRMQISLKHFQAIDTLMSQIRKTITTQSDKISFGEMNIQNYENALNVCFWLLEFSNIKKSEEYKHLAFYFSEKNKSQVLLQALSGQEAQKFSGIPDTLLQKEHKLKIDINFYEQKIAEELDSSIEQTFKNKLFTANREYEELISNFETSYPEYFNLKYSTKNPSVKELQKLLDLKTAIRSYFVGDSSIYIFTISNKKFDVQKVAKIDNLEDTIRHFRYGLTKFSERMNDMYRRTGVLLYQQLFPKSIALDKQIENLIIIPDGALATIPFEALLTDNSGSLKGDDFKMYPFLINRYNVSYSYSANLFYRTFSKDNQKQPELTNINDWLALAPVFDYKSEQGVMLATRELQKQLNNLQSDTLNVRGRLLTGDYITPLPGTESETQAIIKQYENRNLKAQALLHKSANEQFIKSGGLEKYKVLHFATHGFVNSEKPELSGILLAQDSTGNQDGVLYSGEIYNLKLNADLVVLSACETGLGKINKGEGIIGLTRALLYAGSKNIIVSLWQVSDESTSNLMIDFYNNLLNTKSKSFSEPLRKAKLKMISEGKFAHPFYWSPFILIGK